MKKLSPWATCLAALILLALPSRALPAEVETRALTPDLFLITGLPNAGQVVFLKTSEGVLVVDSGDSPENGKAIVDKIRSVTGQPIRYVVLTQYHGDHTFGLQSFPQEAVVIGQDKISENIRDFSKSDLDDYLQNRAPRRLAQLRKEVDSLRASASPELGKKEEELKGAQERYDRARIIKLVYPQLTFDRELTIHLGGETVRVLYPGPSHTSCSVVVHFVDQKVLHAGDLFFHGLLPFIDGPAGSNTANWIAALEGYMRLDLDQVVPGHGEVTGKESLRQQIDLLTDLRQEVKTAMAEGRSLVEMKKTILLPKWKEFGYRDVLPIDIEAVYGEMKK